MGFLRMCDAQIESSNSSACASDTYTHLHIRVIDKYHLGLFAVQQNANGFFAKFVICLWKETLYWEGAAIGERRRRKKNTRKVLKLVFALLRMFRHLSVI